MTAFFYLTKSTVFILGFFFFTKVDFEALTRITGCATQGRHDAEQWVKSYIITFSRDGSRYKYYKERRVVKVTEIVTGLRGRDKSTLRVTKGL